MVVAVGYNKAWKYRRFIFVGRGIGFSDENII